MTNCAMVHTMYMYGSNRKWKTHEILIIILGSYLTTCLVQTISSIRKTYNDHYSTDSVLYAYIDFVVVALIKKPFEHLVRVIRRLLNYDSQQIVMIRLNWRILSSKALPQLLQQIQVTGFLLVYMKQTVLFYVVRTKAGQYGHQLL